MKSYTLHILWTKTGDGQPHQRKRTLSVRLPVELHVGTLGATNMTPELLDAILSLPWTPDASYGESRTIRLPDQLDALTDEVVLEIAIPQARAEMEAETRKDAERREAKLAKERAELVEFANGGVDPGYPLTERRAVDWLVPTIHSNLDKVAVKHIVVSHGKDALEGHDELRAWVEARMATINVGARERAEAELVEKEAAQTERERLNAEKEAAKQAVDDARAAEIKAWAAEHGSTRLREQIVQDLPGWPLYLHERLQSEFGDDAELDNDGETGDELVNPTKAQLDFARQIAVLVVERGLRADVNTAFVRIAIVPITFGADVDEDGYCDGVPETRIYVTFDGYRPGSEAFAVKTIRFVCEE